jgi:hypothetical protein
MAFFYTLISDSMVFAALSWFSGYGALGPATGIRLSFKNKARLYGEVFCITLAMLYLVLMADRMMGAEIGTSIMTQPDTYRLVAMAAVITAGYWYTKRRARAMNEALDSEPAQNGDDEPHQS